MNRWDTGLIAVLAAATVQIGEQTIGWLVTALVVPLAGVAWREREKRMAAEAKCERLTEKIEEFKDETPELHDEVRMLRAEVHSIRRDTAYSPSRGAEPFPFPDTRTPRRRPTSWRSTGRSRRSDAGSGTSSDSRTAPRT